MTTTGHAVGDREQVVIKCTDESTKETGKLAKATSGPSDFTRLAIIKAYAFGEDIAATASVQ